jgi:predicted nucleic acid-binding Zn ribbon protein
MISAPAIQFKGAGWYVTDYASKTSGGDPDKPATETANKGAETKETGSKDSKEKKSAKKK